MGDDGRLVCEGECFRRFRRRRTMSNIASNPRPSAVTPEMLRLVSMGMEGHDGPASAFVDKGIKLTHRLACRATLPRQQPKPVRKKIHHHPEDFRTQVPNLHLPKKEIYCTGKYVLTSTKAVYKAHPEIVQCTLRIKDLTLGQLKGRRKAVTFAGGTNPATAAPPCS